MHQRNFGGAELDVRVLTGTQERTQALLEIDALLDHLLRQKNTPVHVAKKIIFSFCPCISFAFPHLICDGVLTCSSIPSSGSNTTGISTLDDKWQDKNGTPIRSGVVQLDTSGQTVTDELFASFLTMCRTFGSTFV